MTRVTIVRPLLDSRDTSKDVRRISVALEARCHREFRYLRHDIHVLNLSMTIRAINAAIDMGAMVEVGIVRHPMNAFPWHRDSLFVVLRQLDDLGAVLAGNCVAIHTD